MNRRKEKWSVPCTKCGIVRRIVKRDKIKCVDDRPQHYFTQRVISQAHRQAISRAGKGRHLSDIHIQRIREAWARKRINKNCEACGESISLPVSHSFVRSCGGECKNRLLLGRIVSEETRQKMCLAVARGEKHWAWKHDRNSLKKRQMRNDSAYQNWHKLVKSRDSKCRMANENCNGLLIVHHILPWRAYSEERYNVNNGITLCQYHHPRKRTEEERLIPIFQNLITT